MDTFYRKGVVGGMRRQAELIIAGGRYRRVGETVAATGSSRLSRETTLLLYLAPLALVARAGGPPGGRGGRIQAIPGRRQDGARDEQVQLRVDINGRRRGDRPLYRADRVP